MTHHSLFQRLSSGAGSLKAKTRGIPFSYRLLVAHLVIIILAFAVLASLLFINFIPVLSEREIFLRQDAVARLQESIESKYTNAMAPSRFVQGNLRYYLTEAVKYPERAYDPVIWIPIYTFVASIYKSDPDIMDFFIVSVENQLYSGVGTKNRSPSASFDYMSYPLTQKLLESDGNMLVTYDDSVSYMVRQSAPVISVYSKIWDVSQGAMRLLGYSCLNFSARLFEESFMTFRENMRGALYLVDGDGKVLISSESGQAGTVFTAPSESKDTHVISLDIEDFGLTLVHVVDAAELMPNIRAMQSQFILVLGSVITVLLLSTILLQRLYSRKVGKLVDFIVDVQRGQLDARLPVFPGDEIGRLSNSLNQMCQQLNQYIQATYASEARQRTAEFNALQAQINPHFLFNTIETIRMQAVAADAKDVANMLANLGELFRWNIRFSENIVSLEDELNYIGCYLAIQQQRFKDKINFHIDADEVLYDYGIPKFVLQPLVENAVSHGVSERLSGGLILIKVSREDEILRVDVCDNGIGIPNARLEQLRAELCLKENRDALGVGIKNVNDRIRYLLGEEFGLRIDSEEGKGTVVTLMLPAMPVEEMKQCTNY